MPTHHTLGPVMLDIEGPELSQHDKELLANPLVGGLILFSRNFTDLDQLDALIIDVRACKDNVIIAVDHEGGRVQRFKKGFNHLPPMDVLGRHFSERGENGEQALALAKELGWLMASELLCFDIDISFAPVLDRNYGVSAVIGDRAFSDNPHDIVLLSAAFIEGMHEAGMASTGKHFPGHGFIAADSHTEIPVDERSEREIMENDMCIFADMVDRGMDAVMPAHVIYSQVDEKPAGFSPYWIQDVLRKRLRFDGVVFSDDLSMEGATVAGSFAERADAALKAGCDMVLVCNNRDAANTVLEALKNHQIDERSSARLSCLRGNTSYSSLRELQQEPRWQNISKKINAFKEKGETALWTY